MSQTRSGTASSANSTIPAAKDQNFAILIAADPHSRADILQGAEGAGGVEMAADRLAVGLQLA